MPRIHGKIKIEVWDSGSDFRELSVDAQWAYEMLVSQPGVTMCGVLPYTPKKWAKLARGLTLERVEAAIFELEDAWYVIVDRETDELLIRTFIRHDEPWKLPNLVKAARRQLREVDSQVIRDYLVERHEWLIEKIDEDVDAKEWAKKIAQIREYEARRVAERASERTLRLPLDSAQPSENERASERASGRPSERASEWPRTRAGARTPTATATTTATAPTTTNHHPSQRSETPRAEPDFEGEEP